MIIFVKKLVRRMMPSVFTPAAIAVSVMACSDMYQSSVIDTDAKCDSEKMGDQQFCEEKSPAGNTLQCSELADMNAYMACHDNLLLYMSTLINYREPFFFCFYDGETSHSLNSEPVGKTDSNDGVPFGELSAIPVPGLSWRQNPGTYFQYALTTDRFERCPATTPTEGENWAFVDGFNSNNFDSKHFPSPHGYIYPRHGGEDWGDICGEYEDESCRHLQSNIFFIEGEIRSPSETHGKTSLRIFHDTWTWGGDHRNKSFSLCWDPDDGGPESSVLLADADHSNVGFINFEPITSGTLHLHLNPVDCTGADIADAAATLPIPTPMTYGPPNRQVEFAAGTQGEILVVGSSLKDAPRGAGMKIVPILYW